MTVGTPRAWGADGSFDRLTPQRANQMRESGVEIYVQCLWTGIQKPTVAVTNLINAQDAGLVIAGYASVSSGRDGAAHMDAARAGIPDDIWESMTRVALDMELPGLNYENHVLAGLARLVELGHGDNLIYTGKGAWNDFMPGKPAPFGSFLWNASWGMPSAGPMLPSPYAGWTEPMTVGLQFEGGAEVPEFGGFTADRNTFDRAYWMPAPPPIAEVDYVTHITQYFHSGKVWEMDVLPPPEVQR